MALNMGMLLTLVFISLFKGDGEVSLIGVKRCDDTDWALFGVLQLLCFIFLALGIWVVRKEYNQKVKHGYKFTQGDLTGAPADVLAVVLISFFGAMSASFSGAGTGALFSPVFIMRGMEPRVSFATAMYIAMFTCLASSIAMIMFKKLRLDYALYIQLMTVFGTVPGYFFQQYI